MAGGGDLCPTEAVTYGIGLGYTDRELGEEKNWGRKDFFTRKATKLVQATHTHHNSQLNKRTQEMFEALAYMQHPRSPRTHAHHFSCFESISFCQLLPRYPRTPGHGRRGLYEGCGCDSTVTTR